MDAFPAAARQPGSGQLQAAGEFQLPSAAAGRAPETLSIRGLPRAVLPQPSLRETTGLWEPEIHGRRKRRREAAGSRGLRGALLCGAPLSGARRSACKGAEVHWQQPAPLRPRIPPPPFPPTVTCSGCRKAAPLLRQGDSQMVRHPRRPQEQQPRRPSAARAERRDRAGERTAASHRTAAQRPARPP